MLTNWPLTSYLYCLNCPIHISKTIPRQTEKGLQLLHCAAFLTTSFHAFITLKSITRQKKTKKTFSKKENIFTMLSALSISSIFQLIHFFCEHQMICRIKTKSLKKTLFQNNSTTSEERKPKRRSNLLYSQKHVQQRKLNQYLPYSRSYSVETEKNSEEFYKLITVSGTITYQNSAKSSDNNLLGPTNTPFQTALLLIFIILWTFH